MRKNLIPILVIILVACMLTVLTRVKASNTPTRWSGVDETVVEKFAAQAGHPARKPYINTDRGDMLLFVFLTGGMVGGFIGGYCFRELFPPSTKAKE
jgi:cobalt/nickel transport protein